MTAKTVERSVSPAPESDLLQPYQRRFAERNPLCLYDQGIAELPLDRLKTILARQGLVMYAAKVRGPKQCVAYIAEDDRGEVFGLFELWPIEKEGGHHA